VKICIDFDSTIVDTSYAMFLYYQDKTKDTSIKYDKNKTSWSMTELLPLFSKEEIDNIFIEEDFFNYLQLLPNAYEVLNRLSEDFELEIITYHNPKGIKLKENWIKNNLPMIDIITILPLENSKMTLDKSCAEGFLLIDDNIDCLKSSNTRYRICFGRYQWNTSYCGSKNNKRCLNWVEVEKQIQHLRKASSCEFCGCTDTVFFNSQVEMYLCDRHSSQIKKYGKLLNKTKYDKNEIRINNEENYAEIILYNSKLKEIATAIIDIDDVEKIKNYKWTARLNKNNTKYYIFCKIDKNTIILHRYLLNIHNKKNNLVVDHINRNTLDNRKSNLRICTNQENLLNKELLATNTSGFLGIYYNKNDDNWCAEIKIKGFKCYLGAYETKEEALIARLLGEKLLCKEFAPQKHLYNLIPDNTNIFDYIKYNTRKGKLGKYPYRVLDTLKNVLDKLEHGEDLYKMQQ
jgi:5'(3')-deoxyribonucleotidase